MKASPKYSKMPKSFWATVRSVSQEVGYTVRNQDQVKVPSVAEIREAFRKLSLDPDVIFRDEKPTELANDLVGYYHYRADVLNNFVEPRLMDADRASTEFYRLHGELNPKVGIPLNKQKGEKKSPAFLTGIINMIVEANAQGLPCDYDPRELTTVTMNGAPLRTLSRRVDGAFPSAVNPIAIWEVKEYYYTTTFGSRVADGVYETLLDGMELEELHEHENIKVLHYLMIDAYFTWWKCGRSYLCRMIDMLNMGYVDEILFGYEIIEELPKIVRNWVKITKA